MAKHSKSQEQLRKTQQNIAEPKEIQEKYAQMEILPGLLGPIKGLQKALKWLHMDYEDLCPEIGQTNRPNTAWKACWTLQKTLPEAPAEKPEITTKPLREIVVQILLVFL